MSRTHTFVVTLRFADKISDDMEIIEVAENIANAIIEKTENHEVGIVPENSETYTKSIQVSQNGIILCEEDIV